MQLLSEQCELLRPLIAVNASDIAHQIAKKNGFDFAQMLLPYAKVQISIREPLGTPLQHNLHLDIRDMRRSGFLLSHSVFRFVLQESILDDTARNVAEAEESILLTKFYHTFLHWHEPSEHEFLRTYLACIFVVSTADPDPLNKLKELEAEQHREQHGEVGNPTAKRISPAYCVPSKWFFPNILKYYLIVHDNSLGHLDPERSKSFFASICSRYGDGLCQMIYLNSADPSNPADAGMPDPWEPILHKNNLGLRSGLDLAKRNLISPNKPIKHTFESQRDLSALAAPPPSIPPVHSAPSLSPPSTSPPPLFTTTATFNPNPVPVNYHYSQQMQFPPPNQSQHYFDHSNPNSATTAAHPLTYAQVAEGTSSHDSIIPTSNSSPKLGQAQEEDEDSSDKIHGQWLSAEDRQQLRKFVEDFVRRALVPFVEKQLAEQSEIVLNRRSLAKSTFSSMRKWLQSATTNTAPATISAQQQQQPQLQQNRMATVSYPAESAECQTRRLADLAFLFGLYQYSNQIYQSLKKDFANDQAWLYHAGCLEMASTSAFLTNWKQYLDQIVANPALKQAALVALRKQYPQRYMDNAVHFYANVCRQPLLAIRALMNGMHILTQLELLSEAAEQLIRFNNSSIELLSLDSSLFDTVLLEHAARLFAHAGNRRRKADFYLATAGTRLLKFAFEQPQISPESLRKCKRLSRKFYEEVLGSTSFTGKGWTWTEHYLLCQYISCI